MRGDGSRPGPPAGLRPHGVLSRGILTSPAECEKSSTDAPSLDLAPGCEEEEGKPSVPSEGEPAIRIDTAPHFFTARTFTVDQNKPLGQRIKRRGTTVSVQPGPDVGSGAAYRRHIPLTTHLRINDSDGPPMSSLLDTGASLSVIDRNLLEVLEGTAQGTPMPIHGLGNASSLGWCTIPFFIDARDDRGRDVSLECKVDFHVVEAFAPGLCLGQDFISTHSIAIHCRRGTAELQQGGRTFTFRVHEHMFAPFAPQAELCTTRDVVVRARSHVWVPVNTGSLAPGLYYTAFPRLGVNEAESPFNTPLTPSSYQLWRRPLQFTPQPQRRPLRMRLPPSLWTWWRNPTGSVWSILRWKLRPPWLMGLQGGS
ncbi:hypothetical protein CF326_g9217 [Tilletia indica]|nr:hypothetical protein CF326_g9217 [Tilletia indica]